MVQGDLVIATVVRSFGGELGLCLGDCWCIVVLDDVLGLTVLGGFYDYVGAI